MTGTSAIPEFFQRTGNYICWIKCIVEKRSSCYSFMLVTSTPHVEKFQLVTGVLV